MNFFSIFKNISKFTLSPISSIYYGLENILLFEGIKIDYCWFLFHLIAFESLEFYTSILLEKKLNRLKWKSLRFYFLCLFRCYDFYDCFLCRFWHVFSSLNSLLVILFFQYFYLHHFTSLVNISAIFFNKHLLCLS